MSTSNSPRSSTRPLSTIGIVVALLGLIGGLIVGGSSLASAGGNSGNPHPDYLVNIIGVDNPKKADLTDSSRRTIFVALNGKSKINLVEGEFSVIDGNGTDRDGATLALPDPDVDGDGVLDGTYEVSVRALGKPGGQVTISTCAELLADLGGQIKNRVSDLDESAYCTIDSESVRLERKKGQPLWGNVTSQLLSITFEVEITLEDGSTITEFVTIPLFDDRIEGEFWEYDNNGVRLVQVRFSLN